jgi:hypothetical protein
VSASPWCPIRAQTSENKALELGGEADTTSAKMAEQSHLPPLHRTCRHNAENPVDVRVLSSRIAVFCGSRARSGHRRATVT